LKIYELVVAAVGPVNLGDKPSILSTLNRLHSKK
jgi:hypothetical protein